MCVPKIWLGDVPKARIVARRSNGCLPRDETPYGHSEQRRNRSKGAGRGTEHAQTKKHLPGDGFLLQKLRPAVGRLVVALKHKFAPARRDAAAHAVVDVGRTQIDRRLRRRPGHFKVQAAAPPERDPRRVEDDARVDARDDQGLEEAEEAWDLRDAGYDAVWVSDVLYKFGSFSGNLFASSPDTITSVVKAMKSKASTKFARASGAFSGKGEGAKEYLGDILM